MSKKTKGKKKSNHILAKGYRITNISKKSIVCHTKKKTNLIFEIIRKLLESEEIKKERNKNTVEKSVT